MARLNTEYQAMAAMGLSMNGIYHYHVETENYRMVSGVKYCWRESPIRGGRGFERPDLTDAEDAGSSKVRLLIGTRTFHSNNLKFISYFFRHMRNLPNQRSRPLKHRQFIHHQSQPGWLQRLL